MSSTQSVVPPASCLQPSGGSIIISQWLPVFSCFSHQPPIVLRPVLYREHFEAYTYLFPFHVTTALL
jgi:hypothetical protein